MIASALASSRPRSAQEQGPPIAAEDRALLETLRAGARVKEALSESAPRRLGAWKAAAEAGEPVAQYLHGLCAIYGIESEEGDAKAAEWFRKAAEQGNANAQANLGRLYERGIGVKKDRDAALAWYRKAAAQGLSEAEKALRRLEGR